MNERWQDNPEFGLILMILVFIFMVPGDHALSQLYVERPNNQGATVTVYDPSYQGSLPQNYIDFMQINLNVQQPLTCWINIIAAFLILGLTIILYKNVKIFNGRLRNCIYIFIILWLIWSVFTLAFWESIGTILFPDKERYRSGDCSGQVETCPTGKYYITISDGGTISPYIWVAGFNTFLILLMIIFFWSSLEDSSPPVTLDPTS